MFDIVVAQIKTIKPDVVYIQGTELVIPGRFKQLSSNMNFATVLKDKFPFIRLIAMISGFPSNGSRLNDVDILFGNQDEFTAMVNSKNLDDGIAYAKSLKKLSIITLADKGSLIVNDARVLKINAEPVSQVIDTTGAGDLFAAGFLYGMTHKKNLIECGRLASIAAAEIISHFGVRPKFKLSSLI